MTRTKIAEREFRAFQIKKSAPEIYTDPNLDKAVPLSEHFKDFPSAVLAAPPIVPPPGKVRIHQALKAGGMGYQRRSNRFRSTLGVPALNAGDMPGLVSKIQVKIKLTGLFALY